MSVGADSEQPSTSEAGLLKEQGNAEFKAASYLKAAATYTRAIKLAASLPTAEQAVLYRWAAGRAQGIDGRQPALGVS